VDHYVTMIQGGKEMMRIINIILCTR